MKMYDNKTNGVLNLDIIMLSFFQKTLRSKVNRSSFKIIQIDMERF